MKKKRLGVGPNEMPMYKLNADPALIHSIAYTDFVNYLLFKPSPYTAEDLMKYAGMEAYNKMVCGWVRNVYCRVLHKEEANDLHLLKSR